MTKRARTDDDEEVEVKEEEVKEEKEDEEEEDESDAESDCPSCDSRTSWETQREMITKLKHTNRLARGDKIVLRATIRMAEEVVAGLQAGYARLVAKHAHLTAENARLSAEIARLTHH